jgi:hypothetical protein
VSATPRRCASSAAAVVKPAGRPGRRTPGPTARGALLRTGGSLLDHRQQCGQARRTHRAVPQPARGQAPMRSGATCARRLDSHQADSTAWSPHGDASCRVVTYWSHRYGWRWCQLQVMLVWSGWRSRPAAAAAHSPYCRRGDQSVEHCHARRVTRSVPRRSGLNRSSRPCSPQDPVEGSRG